MYTIINTTPHDITEVSSGRVFKKDENYQLRINTTYEKAFIIDEIQIYNQNYGKLNIEPPIVENTFYITSLLVRQGYPHRKDFISPGDLVRNDSGQPIGCKGFVN